MADSMCLQDWITLSGNGNTIIQPQSGWLEVYDYQDLLAYLEVAACTVSTVTLDLQSSPTSDDAFFNTSVTIGNNYVVRYSLTTSSSGVQGMQLSRWAGATNQLLARFLRWKITFPAGATSLTFRMWLCLNRAGARWNGSGPATRVATPSAVAPEYLSRLGVGLKQPVTKIR